MKNYNTLFIDFEYPSFQNEQIEFLENLQDELGWYDKNNTVKCLEFEPVDNADGFVLTDLLQKIDPDKLSDAFDDYLNIEEEEKYNAETDEYETIKTEWELKEEFIKNLVKKIRESNIF